MLAESRMAAGHYFVIRAKPNGTTRARLGIIAARRVIPRAVDRNRCKRVARAMFRATQGELTALDVVVICRKAVSRSRSVAAGRELFGLLMAVGKDGIFRPAAGRE